MRSSKSSTAAGMLRLHKAIDQIIAHDDRLDMLVCDPERVYSVVCTDEGPRVVGSPCIDLSPDVLGRLQKMLRTCEPIVGEWAARLDIDATSFHTWTEFTQRAIRGVMAPWTDFDFIQRACKGAHDGWPSAYAVLVSLRHRAASDRLTPTASPGAAATVKALPSSTGTRATATEANIAARKFLRTNPGATVRQLADGIGCSLGLAAELPAWRAVNEQRRKGRLPKSRTPVQLTTPMLAVVPREDTSIDELIEDQAADRRADRRRHAVR
jgi:hypothetical protein